jgi:type I restriction-modification system DNA methylase subunit
VDLILTNPPFGGTEEPGTEANFPADVRTKETADLFLVLIVELLQATTAAPPWCCPTAPCSAKA